MKVWVCSLFYKGDFIKAYFESLGDDDAAFYEAAHEAIRD